MVRRGNMAWSSVGVKIGTTWDEAKTMPEGSERLLLSETAGNCEDFQGMRLPRCCARLHRGAPRVCESARPRAILASSAVHLRRPDRLLGDEDHLGDVDEFTALRAGQLLQ